MNVFSLADAEEYLFNGLTAEFPDERNGFAALHFVALGHALHMLEDMSSPPHVRNDFIVEHLQGAITGEGLEDKGEDPRRLTADVLTEVTSIPDIDTTGFDVSDFFVRSAIESPSDATGSPGLAEYVHDHFLSNGSFAADAAYTRPHLPSCLQPGASTGTGADTIEVRDLPDRDLESGFLIGNSTQRYLVRGGRRVVACSMYEISVEGGRNETVVIPTTWNDGVRRDTFEVLWPLAVAYGREFLEFYYQPRLKVVRTGPRTFRLANPTMLPLEIPVYNLFLVYGTRDAQTGLERRVTRVLDGCGTGVAIELAPASEPGALGELSDVECELPLALAERPIDATQFWIVARGQHGERNAVVAFDRVTAELYYERGSGEAVTGGAEWTDAGDQRDIGVLAFAIPEATDASARLSTDANVTAVLRSGPSALGTDVDFFAPTIDADGLTIAVSSDIRRESGQVGLPSDDADGFPVVSELTIFDIGAWASPRQLLAPSNQVPFCNYDCPPVFDPTSTNRLYFNTRSLITLLAVANPATGSVQNVPGSIQVTAAHGNKLVGQDSGANIWAMIDTATGQRTHVFDLTSLRVVACSSGGNDPCSTVPSLRYAADMRLSPDGRSAVMAVFDDPELEGGVLRRHSGDLYVADLTSGVVRRVLDWSGRAQYPTFSPDGRWLAFHSDAAGEEKGHTFVTSLEDGRVRQVSTQKAARYESVWAPGLVLPE